MSITRRKFRAETVAATALASSWLHVAQNAEINSNTAQHSLRIIPRVGARQRGCRGDSQGQLLAGAWTCRSIRRASLAANPTCISQTDWAQSTSCPPRAQTCKRSSRPQDGSRRLFKDYPTVWAAMDGDLGGHVRIAIEKVNLHAVDKVLDNGYRNITTSTKPIKTATT